MFKQQLGLNNAAILEGHTPQGRPYSVIPNANSTIPELYIFNMPDGVIQPHQLTRKAVPGFKAYGSRNLILQDAPESKDGAQLRRVIVSCEKNIATIEVLPQADNDAWLEIVALAEAQLEEELYQSSKRIKEEASKGLIELEAENVSHNDTLGGSKLLQCSLFISCLLCAVSIRYLPTGALPDDLIYCILALLIFSALVSWFLPPVKTLTKILLVSLIYCGLQAATLWLNAFSLQSVTQYGQIIEVLHGSVNARAPTIIRLVREPDLQQISLIAREETDFAVGDLVAFDTYHGFLNLKATSNLRVVRANEIGLSSSNAP